VLQVEHLDDLLKVKDERIEELQKQLERKQARRREVETYQNSLNVPFETVQSPVVDSIPISRKSSLKSVESNSKVPKEESRIPVLKTESFVMKQPSISSITEVSSADIIKNEINNVNILEVNNLEKIKSDVFQDVIILDDIIIEKKESKCCYKIEPSNENIEIQKGKMTPDSLEAEEFKDSSPDQVVTIEATIKKEISDIIMPSQNTADLNYII
jgi:hypothetical protein